jgi:hypothetical protein
VRSGFRLEHFKVFTNSTVVPASYFIFRRDTKKHQQDMSESNLEDPLKTQIVIKWPEELLMPSRSLVGTRSGWMGYEYHPPLPVEEQWLSFELDRNCMPGGEGISSLAYQNSNKSVSETILDIEAGLTRIFLT